LRPLKQYKGLKNYSNDIKSPFLGFFSACGFFKNNLKKGQYFLNVTLQPITFATPR